MSREYLSSDEVIELGRNRRAVPVSALRGVIDEWTRNLAGQVTEILALADRLEGPEAAAHFRSWVSRRVSVSEAKVMAGALPHERWETVRRTAYELLGVAQAFTRTSGPYLSGEEDDSLGMEMDRALGAIGRAEAKAKPLRPELRDAVSLIGQRTVQGLNEAGVGLSSILPAVKGRK